MAYSTALEEEEEAGWQCCMPPRGSFGVLTHAQGAAEGVRSRDNPPPQPRPVEAHLTTAMRSPRLSRATNAPPFRFLATPRLFADYAPSGRHVQTPWLDKFFYRPAPHT